MRNRSHTRLSTKMAIITILSTTLGRLRPLGGGRTRTTFAAAFSVVGNQMNKGHTFLPKIRLSPTSLFSTLEASTIKAPKETTKEPITHPSYSVVHHELVPEYNLLCTLYEHTKSSAQLLSVQTDDSNKVFGITLRTPPDDSTGVPHILEHSVLCGSRKYTTKDPFATLLRGSLQTFLNAFTYPDRTCYVCASENKNDFKNLVNVYADAVFFPRATNDKRVLEQEGWHLELESKEDELTYKGVVYNEMKGVYSSPDSLMGTACQKSLFPDTTYGVDSGGDPKNIVDLTFEDFSNFHKIFYHPSNARIYFSGDDDVLERLDLMDEYLKEFDKSSIAVGGTVDDSKIPFQKKTFPEVRRLKEHFPAPPGDGADLHMITMNWLLNDATLTPLEDLTLYITDSLLMGTTSAILYKTLVESGLGSAVTGGGLSSELLQNTFSVGMKGVKEEDKEKVEKLVLDTLEKSVKEGFSEEAISAALNTAEFQMREFNTGSFPKGLSIMLGMMSKWIYDESPTDAIKFEAPLAELKESINKSGSKIFQDMISDLLLENNHRSVVEMIPSATLEEDLLKEERDKLSSIKASLDEDALQKIIDDTGSLKKLQAEEESPEDRATIPSLTLADLDPEPKEYPLEVSTHSSGVTLVTHDLPSTSGIAYVKFMVDISDLTMDEVVLLPLFTRLMSEAGAGKYNDVQLSRAIGANTGGLSTSYVITNVRPSTQAGDDGLVGDGDHLITKLSISGKATAEKAEDLFDLMKLILTDTKLDSQSKVREWLKQMRSGLESGISGSGHMFANRKLAARYDNASFLSEIMSGITYLETIKELQEQVEADWPSLLARFKNIRETILNHEKCRDGMIFDITAEPKVMSTVQPSLDAFLNSLPGSPTPSQSFPDFYATPHPWIPSIQSKMSTQAPLKNEGFIVPTQVSYVGKGGRIYDSDERIAGSASVVRRFLGTNYLWDHVRVIGGAYGGFCQLAPNGVFSYLSYRDPNLAETLDVYDRAHEELLESAKALEDNNEILESAIIGAMGDMDSPLSPDQKGATAFTRWLTNQSAEQRKKFRREILETKPSDFRDFAERLRRLKEDEACKASVSVISSKAAFSAAEEKGTELTLTDVM